MSEWQKHDRATLWTERRVPGWATEELLRHQRARLDAVLAECARLREEARMLEREAERYRAKGNAEAMTSCLLLAKQKRQDIDAIERALKDQDEPPEGE